ncbi:MAG: hypothetical protein MUD08_06285 [Cytophagales bacterium]|nr:hypothetical protein [Cytophagales bacterium]
MLGGFGHELERPEHVAVVGEGHGGHAVGLGLFHKPPDVGRAVEQRKLGMAVQVAENHGRSGFAGGKQVRKDTIFGRAGGSKTKKRGRWATLFCWVGWKGVLGNFCLKRLCAAGFTGRCPMLAYHAVSGLL